MLRSNGGSVEAEEDEWLLHPIFDDSDHKRLKRTFNDIVRETSAARQWRGFPSEAVAIAANGSGDHLVLVPDGCNDQFSETVYVWEHETAELRKIAASFAELERER